MKIIFSVIAGILMVFAMVSEGFSDNQQNLAAVDRALLSSLQNLKESMQSVGDLSQNLQQENDLYRERIQSMNNALGRSDAQKKFRDNLEQEVHISDKLKETRLIDKTLSRRMEAYQALNSEYADLSRRIEAKEENILKIQNDVGVLTAQMDVIQNQKLVMNDFSEPFFDSQVEDLEKLFRESRDSLDLQQQQKERFDLNPEAITALTDSEIINKKIWSEMQSLERELKSLAEQWAQTDQDRSIQQQARIEKMSLLESEIEAINEQRQALEADIQDISLLPEIEALDDQVLKDYRGQLERKNQWLRARVVSLRNFLPEL